MMISSNEVRWQILIFAAFAALACSQRTDHEAIPAAELGEKPPAGTETSVRQERLDELATLHREGQYLEGLSSTRDALQSHPEDPALHHHLGSFLTANAQFDDARLAFERALELQPNHYPSERALGDLARHRGEPDAAARHFARCTEGLPEHAGCRFGLALAYIELGDLEPAVEPLQFAAAKLDRADAWAELGQLHRRLRQTDSALDAYSQALARDRHHLATLSGYGQLLLAIGRTFEGRALLDRHRSEAALDDQLSALRRSAQQNEAQPELIFQLADLLRARGQVREAEAVLRRLVRERHRNSRGYPPAVLALANHLIEHGGAVDEAAALVASLDSQTLEQPAVHFIRGITEVARRDEAAALRFFERSRTAGPWPAPVALDAGKAWFAAGYPERAIPHFVDATEVDDPGTAYLGLARSHAAAGNLASARESAGRATAFESAAAEGHLVFGILLAEAHDESTAQSTLSSGFELRIVDLLAADGATKLRSEIEPLDPSASSLEFFDRCLEEYLSAIRG